jgi:hypothetical protein
MEILNSPDVTESIAKTVIIYMKKTLPIGKNKLRLSLQLPKDQREALKINLLKQLNTDKKLDVLFNICDLISEITSSFYNDKLGLLP